MTNVIRKDHCHTIKRILIVEDIPSLANFLKETIEEKNTIHCDVALNEEEGKKLIAEHEYQLVIVDLLLPDSTGNFIGFLIRKKLKILIMTASDNTLDREKLIKLPIVDYISKTDEKSLSKYMTSTIERLEKNEKSLVVVCDDSKISRRYVTNILTNQNIAFIEFENGKDAYEYILSSDSSVDLLISDFEMPFLSGLELTRKLRLEFEPLDLPIMIQSGKSEASDIANMLKMGANEYIRKPVPYEEFVARVNTLLDHSRMFQENQKLAEQLHLAAMQDNLTTLYNRNYFYQIFKAIFSHITRQDSQYGILFLDIDYFKKCNDDYGHDVGDTVLKNIASLLKETARPTDIVCRWGGEEFLIIASDSTLEGMYKLGERIRKTVEKLEISISKDNSENISVTISGGIAVGKTDDVDQIIKEADARLYTAKENGRNQIVYK